jgi:chorismate dehydratase
LVWGLERGPQKDLFELSFEIPSVCADRLAAGTADIGLLPVIETRRQALDFLPGLGIACHGPVRSILLVSHVPAPEIRSLAVDCSSRTSVALVEVVLRERFGVTPAMHSHGPQLAAMLETADAALLIGDSALRFHPDELPYHVYDLGQEWRWLTGLPMVFAVWSARPGVIDASVAAVLRASADFGRQHIEEIIAEESRRRGFEEDLVRRYLTHYIHFDLTPEFEAGMQRFLSLAGV